MRRTPECGSTCTVTATPPMARNRRPRSCAGPVSGVDVLALTDQDTTDGLLAAAAALPLGLTLVPGMELSCRREGMSIHMLAYLFDPDEPQLAAECRRIRDARVDRGRRWSTV